jgi:hypothetical protein
MQSTTQVAKIGFIVKVIGLKKIDGKHREIIETKIIAGGILS